MTCELLNQLIFCCSVVKMIENWRIERFINTKCKICLCFLAQTYLQPHYCNGVFNNVYLSAGQH